MPVTRNQTNSAAKNAAENNLTEQNFENLDESQIFGPRKAKMSRTPPACKTRAQEKAPKKRCRLETGSETESETEETGSEGRRSVESQSIASQNPLRDRAGDFEDIFNPDLSLRRPDF